MSAMIRNSIILKVLIIPFSKVSKKTNKPEDSQFIGVVGEGEGATSFLWLLHFTLDLYIIYCKMSSKKASSTILKFLVRL